MIAKVPKIQSDDRVITQLQSNIITPLNNVLSNPLVNGSLIQNVLLASGDNTINHKLGRKLTGWFLTRVKTGVTVYDKQDSNSMPDLTLTLNASTATTVDIYVF